ncbi:C2H2 type zinc-finger-domain-containing protein [Halteromyces radiatus]|uniref:C2H2 type zinc-finger-domain-containing protein n=1 Tax=Halteromyces radiatus TaxID=101107 RepID=UPI00221E619A|nr:C2H2 type zinc-finger-domain-containing protein [Halteromyces radiatus]KAI8088640.1 C2H2 type zinc-finger-domain-containing protein [Halteromyces radiatus]
MSENLVPSSGLYTCISCKVAFESAETQRLHYRSDWHRYNLKRKVADLPPVTREQFEQKDQARKEETEKQVEKPVFKGYCDACRKSFGTENQYNNHIQSKKHKDSLAKYVPRAKKNQDIVQEKPLDMTFTEETTEEEIMSKIDAKIKAAPRLTEKDCLFCQHVSIDFEENMTHMTKVHSFFIPDIEFLVDLQGLIRYLGEKISVGNICLFCNGKGKGFSSMDAVRKHMTDKGHCKLAYEDEDDAVDLVDFYDFSTSYPQPEDGETVDIDEELTELTNQLHLADDELSLVLPSGAVVGHRHMKRYYDQKLRPEETRDSILINKLIGQYSDSNVFESLRSFSSSHQRRMITDGKRGVIKSTEAFKEKRIHQDYKTRVGMQANKLQKYFREQII